MLPAKEIPLSARDVRRIMEFARAGAHDAIENAEIELTRHLAMIAESAPDVVTHAFFDVRDSRAERVATLRADLARYHELHARIVALARQLRDADTERSADEIARAVMANRRDERRANDVSKTVGEG